MIWRILHHEEYYEWWVSDTGCVHLLYDIFIIIFISGKLYPAFAGAMNPENWKIGLFVDKITASYHIHLLFFSVHSNHRIQVLLSALIPWGRVSFKWPLWSMFFTQSLDNRYFSLLSLSYTIRGYSAMHSIQIPSIHYALYAGVMELSCYHHPIIIVLLLPMPRLMLSWDGTCSEQIWWNINLIPAMAV